MNVASNLWKFGPILCGKLSRNRLCDNMKAISMGVSAVRSGVSEKSRFALGAVLWSKHSNAILRPRLPDCAEE